MPNRTKFSQKRVKQICALVESGKHSITEICSLVGISRRVFYKWEKERAQFADSLTRARTRARKKESEQIKVLSERGMRILLQGGFLRWVEITQFYGSDGKVSNREITTQLKYFEPCLKTILFVLNNKEKENWPSRLRSHINWHLRELNTTASNAGAQVITVAEAAKIGLELQGSSPT